MTDAAALRTMSIDELMERYVEAWNLEYAAGFRDDYAAMRREQDAGATRKRLIRNELERRTGCGGPAAGLAGA